MSTRFPGRRFSWFRLGVLAVVLGLVGYAVTAGVTWVRDTVEAEGDPSPWFAGYVDVTATPSYAFETAQGAGTDHVVLSFIVADTDGSCSPTWGGSYSLEGAATNLDLDRRIARMRAQDRDIVISFGGQANDELALACTDVPSLVEAYREVIDRYDVSTIDLDIEGDALEDPVSGERRAQAIAVVQQGLRESGDELAVWLTLPVTTAGLTEIGTDTVARFLDSGVDLAGVNAMTMNFGASFEGNAAESSEQALTSVHRQLGVLYRNIDVRLGERSLWRKIGATPMIGQNDVVSEVFTVADARRLNAFATEQQLGRMSMWSLNRDVTCSTNYGDTRRVSDSCSGVEQGTTSFAALLSAGFTSRPEDSVVRTTSEPTPEVIEDDPASSPYPIWNETASYPAGTKIVWHRNVYEAAWWSQGEVPDDPVLQAHETPWRLIGPVLDGEKPVEVPALPEGFYPAWSPETVYEAGARVMLGGIAYQSRWWNQAASPELALADPGSSPWQRLADAEVLLLLGDEAAEVD